MPFILRRTRRWSMVEWRGDYRRGLKTASNAECAVRSRRDIFSFCLVAGLAGASVLFCSRAVAETHETSEPVEIGVLATRGAEQCRARWGPTAQYLTREIPGYDFTISPLGFDELSPAVRDGKVDFVLGNAGAYVDLELRYGATRIVTLRNRLKGQINAGVIFYKADRKDIRSLKDLKGKTFMSVHENALCAWHAVWLELKEAGVDPHRDLADLRFGGNVDKVIEAVRDGTVDAGAVKTGTLERMESEGKIRLKDYRVLATPGGAKMDWPEVFFSTRPYPDWPLAKLVHTPDELAEKVAAALMEMPHDDPAAKAAQCAGWTIPKNYQVVHDCLKALRVGPYRDFGKVTPRDVMRQYWPWLLVVLILGILAVFLTAYVSRLNRHLAGAVEGKHRELGVRKQLQKQILEISDGEQRRIGQDIHDGLLQLLTGVSAMSQLLRDNLVSNANEESGIAEKITGLLSQAIGQTRGLSRGLYPIVIERDGLVSALEELASNTDKLYHLPCRFTARGDISVPDIEVATHLYRIAQEAVNNAARHGDPEKILLDIIREKDQLILRVRDDGKGIPESLANLDRLEMLQASEGMGLRIMKYRSEMIHGALEIRALPGGGTQVTCILPASGDRMAAPPGAERKGKGETR